MKLLLLLFILVSCVETQVTKQELNKEENSNSQAPVDSPQISLGSLDCEKSIMDKLIGSKYMNSKNINVRVLSGEIRHVFVDADPTQSKVKSYLRYDLDTQTGKTMTIPSHFPKIAESIPNSRIALSAKITEHGLEPFVANEKEPYVTLDENGGCEVSKIHAKNIIGTKKLEIDKIHLGVFYPSSRNITQAHADKRAREMVDYYVKVVNGKVAFTAEGVVIDDNSSTFPEAVAEYRRKFPGHFTHAAFMFASGPTQGICGEAGIGATVSYNYCDNLGTALHELGHNLGMHHASTPTSEYGDSTTIMGFSSSNGHLNARQMYQLGFNYEQATKELTSTEKVFLAPVEADESALISGVDQIILIKGYFIGLRDRYRSRMVVQINSAGTYDGNDGTGAYDGNRGSSPLGSMLHHSLTEGSSAEQEGIKVHFVEMHGEIAEVDIYYDSTDSPPAPRPVPGEPIYTCQGNIPANANLCAGDTSNLSANLDLKTVNLCSNRKCEWKCASGFTSNTEGTACISIPGKCSNLDDENVRICEGDGQGLVTDLDSVVVDECTRARKCEFTCAETFIPNAEGTGCIPGPSQCTGVNDRRNIPSNAILCEGDDQDLTKHETARFVSSCGDNRKCEFTCPEGHIYVAKVISLILPQAPRCDVDPNYGVTLQCTGALPDPNAELCESDDQLLSMNTPKRLVSNCTESTKCEYKCKDGFELFQGSCRRVQQPPMNCTRLSYMDMNNPQMITFAHGTVATIQTQGEINTRSCPSGETGQLRVRENFASRFSCNNGIVSFVDRSPLEHVVGSTCQPAGQCTYYDYYGLGRNDYNVHQLNVGQTVTRQVNIRAETINCPGSTIRKLIYRVFAEQEIGCQAGGDLPGQVGSGLTQVSIDEEQRVLEINQCQ